MAEGRSRNPPPQKPRGQLAWHIQWKVTRDPVSNKGKSEDQHPKLSSALHMCYIYTLAHVHTCRHSHIYRVHTHTIGIASSWFMEWNYRSSRDSRNGLFLFLFFMWMHTHISVCVLVQQWTYPSAMWVQWWNSDFMLGAPVSIFF